MAGFITFDISDPNRTWSSSNWVYVSFLDHAIEHLSDDHDAVHRLTSSKYNQSVSLLRLKKEAPVIYAQIVEAFKHVCRQIENRECLATVNGSKLDDQSQLQYREAIHELSELLATEDTRN